MKDTPQHIYDLQLKIWLSKAPGERLLRFLQDNDDLQQALKKAKIQLNLPDTVTNFPPQA
jgi:hypothetical protein